MTAPAPQAGLTVTMLGSGTSSGVPVIGCDCAVCRSSDPRNQRLRAGLWLGFHGPAELQAQVLVDTPTDLRQQAMRFGVSRVDAVLYTHAHADHIFGLDDVRIFNFRQNGPIPCYGSAATLARLRQTFAYVFEGGQEGGGKPQLELNEVREPFSLFGRQVVPIPVLHGSLEVYGYRIGDFAYVTDCNHIPASSFELLQGVEVLILDALRYRPHPTHFSIEEALEASRRIGSRRTIFTHLTHEVDAAAPAMPLPPGVEFGYDGLTFQVH